MSTEVVCSQDGCSAPTGGPCSIGHANPADCPNAEVAGPVETRPEPSTPDEPDTAPTSYDSEGTTEAPSIEAPGVVLGAGTALTIEEANSLAGEAGARLILPVGPVESGKTTLIIGLYERFLTGPWADTSFVWSESLLDLEMLAFPGRLRSGADLPKTWRTRLRAGDRQILHLRVRTPGTDRLDLLFGNVPGESFNHIRDGEQPTTELPLLPGVDFLLICLDGDKLAAPGTYDIALSETRQFLGTIAEAHVLGSSCVAALVLTKLDKVQAIEGGEDRWSTAKAALADDLAQLSVETKTIATSARHETGLVHDDGMPALLALITGSVRSKVVAPESARSPAVRAISRFTGGEHV